MYNLILKKYKLFKIFALIIPKKKRITKSCLYLCKYFINSTPYGQIAIFMQEINKIFNIFIYNSCNKKLLYICSDKIFFFDFINLKKKHIIHSVLKTSLILNEKIKIKQFSFILFYNMHFSQKLVSFFKQKNQPTIGFINFSNQANLTDYTLLLESRFFSSIYFFHFLLKKLIYHVKK